jgi:hypothetical protein
VGSSRSTTPGTPGDGEGTSEGLPDVTYASDGWSRVDVTEELGGQADMQDGRAVAHGSSLEDDVVSADGRRRRGSPGMS